MTIVRSIDKLTDAQSKALKFINRSIGDRGSPPTLREICAFMGFNAIGSAQDVVAALRKKGYLAPTDRQAARAMILSDKAKSMFRPAVNERFVADANEFFQVPCLGSVPAGNPLEAIEERVDTLRISTSLLPRPRPKAEQLFAVRTSGLSMMNAGILDGDWLVIKAQQDAEPGNIVIARVGGDVTCKRLQQDKKRGWSLHPENPSFQPIFADETPFEIVGKVIALQRSIS